MIAAPAPAAPSGLDLESPFPAKETASANGLNTLLRTIGTSTSSATMAAVTTIGLLRVGDEVFPTFGALTAVFWQAGAMSLVSALLVVPMWRMREYADEAPDPDSLRQRFVDGYLDPLAERLGGDDDARLRA